MLIDTHIHLDLMDNMQLLIQEFGRSKDVGIIAVGTTPKAYMREQQFCARALNIKVGLGYHPQLVAERKNEIDLFLKYITEATYVGEIGLDFNKAFIHSKIQQIDCFRKIVRACTDEGNKILSIHSVRAARTVLDELESAGTFNTCKCIMHWFTGKPNDLRRAMNDGAYFSINPRMLKTKSGQETIKSIPINRLLLETDSPFTMKIRRLENLQNELEILVEGISSIRGENIKKTIEENNERILSNVRN